jgi:hypothetical protein
VIRRVVTLTLLAGLICANGYEVTAQKPPSAAKPRCSLTNEDYAVYAALIDGLGRPEDPEEAWLKKDLLILDATAAPTQVESKFGKWGFRSSSKEAPAKDTVASFEARTRKSCPVEPRLGEDHPYRMIASKDLDNLFGKNGGGWQEFYRRYPNAAGFWEFSLPGFNPDRNEAVLYVGHSCGDLCGTGHLYFLAKQNDKWVVRNRLMLWIS